MTTRIFLVDDHEIVRRGLFDLLGGVEDFVVVGEAASVGGSAGCGTAEQRRRRCSGRTPA